MIIDDIITQFEMQVSDITELSPAEEYIVANRVYNAIANDRPWEWLKASSAGSILQDSTGYYITVPSDFAYFAENNAFSENNDATQNNTAPKVIFVGSTYTPVQIINFSDRRQYRGNDHYAYYDAASNAIRFTGTPLALTYEFDYIKTPTALVSGASPFFPAEFHDLIVYGMAVDDAIVQLSPKATSYAAENQVKYNDLLAQLRYRNAQLIQM
jgi:hypothetical protein